MSIQQKYERWESLARELADLGYALRLIDWDAKVMMPEQGIGLRTRSHRFLAGIYHEKMTSPELCALMEDLNEHPGLNDHQQRSIRANYRLHQRRLKMPSEFVQEAAALYAQAYQAWLTARKEEDLSIFLPFLNKIIGVKRKEVELAGYEGEPYEYFTSYFEPGLELTQIDTLFKSFRNNFQHELRELSNGSGSELAEFRMSYPLDRQMDYCQQLIASLGFDRKRGRLDLSEHPFTCGMTADDVRITTRIQENQLAFSVWATLHELGHALYEQHLPKEHYGLPASLPASFGVHESQARFWENHIGRSHEFWKERYPEWKQHFKIFSGVSEDEFLSHVNRVAPNLIRTKADEIHYHFHVLIRYEIEKSLLSGELKITDLKEKWNSLHQEFFGMTASKDSEGVLQDMHWSQGQWGYFPSYSIGSFLAAQLAEAIENELPDYASKAGKGDTSELLKWLDQHIYSKGRLYTIQELSIQATGYPLRLDAYTKYINKKYNIIHSPASLKQN